MCNGPLENQVEVKSFFLPHLEYSCFSASCLVKWYSVRVPTAGGSRDAGLIPVLGRLPEVANGNPLQHSRLGSSLERRLDGYSP